MPRTFKTDDPDSIGRKLRFIENIMARKLFWKHVELAILVAVILIALFI